jgi:hypothetical protein
MRKRTQDVCIGKHPYAAIEHRVIDSLAYADLSHSACRLLTLLARQLTKDNNGNLQATFSWCKPRGIASEHTLRDAIADLIAHGFIFRTRSHGANKTWAKYAVTWLSIKKRDGLFLDCFVPCAWRNWQPAKKSTGQIVQEQSGRKRSFTNEKPAENAGTPPAESADYEFVPIGVSNSPTIATASEFSRVSDSALSEGVWKNGEHINPSVKQKVSGVDLQSQSIEKTPLQRRKLTEEGSRKLLQNDKPTLQRRPVTGQ